MNNSPQRNPRYHAYSSQTKRKKRNKGVSPLSICLILLVCICFLGLSYVLLRNKDQKAAVSPSVSSYSDVSSAPVSSFQEVLSSPSSEDTNLLSSAAPVSSHGNDTPVAGNLAPYSFFDDAIFIGDSITNQLSQYTSRMRNNDPGFLGKARFGGVGSYSVFNALQPVTATDNKGNPLPHHLLNGVRMQTQDFIYARNQERPVNKAFIMFGTNDLNMYKDIPTYLTAYKEYLDRITAKNPQLTIYLMTTTPVTKEYANTHKGKLNPKGIDDYNAQLKTFCAENGYYFIDTNSALRDSSGHLPESMASADGFHPNDIGFDKIITAVRAQVA